MLNGDLKLKTIFFVFMLSFTLVGTINVSVAHILIIGDSANDFPTAYQETTQLAADLRQQGYDVLDLYRGDATAENILKGMYGADAVIYAGHGGYQSGHYDNNGGIASPPFALVGSDDFIWGIGGQMREGWDDDLFTAPFKQGIPVFLLHACFSTGWVEDKQVANPIETVYNFAQMFSDAGANYYATAWNDAEIIYDFLNGASDFQDANNQNYEKILTSTLYNGVEVWRNSNGNAAFVGDWNGVFPTVAQTTAYDEIAAVNWYNSNRQEIPVTTNSYYQTNSAIYNNLVVWQDNRYGNWEIMMKDLHTWAESRVTKNSATQQNPSIYNEIVLWEDDRYGNWEIMMKDLTTNTEKRITSNAAWQCNPVIYGNVVVWEDDRYGNWEVMMKDLTTNTEKRITTNIGTQINPSIYGSMVVWQDNRYGNWEIMMKDLVSGVESRLTKNSGNQQLPAIYGNRVVWEDDRYGNWEIMMKDLSSNTESRVTTNSQRQNNPTIYDNKVVWQDNRYGNEEIMMKNLATNKESRVTNNNDNQITPTISQNTILWESEGNIYMHN